MSRNADPSKVEAHVSLNWVDESVARVCYGGEPTDYVVGKRGQYYVLGLHTARAGDGAVDWRPTHYANTSEITDRLGRYWAGKAVAP